VWLYVDPEIVKLINFIAADESTLFQAAAVLLMALGCFVILVSALGFVGAVVDSTIILGIVSPSGNRYTCKPIQGGPKNGTIFVRLSFTKC